jgi:hypothetical protein
MPLATGSLLWHKCTVLAEPATELRFENRRSGTEGQDRARSRRDGGVARDADPFNCFNCPIIF